VSDVSTTTRGSVATAGDDMTLGESPHLLRGMIVTLVVAILAAGAVLTVRWTAATDAGPPPAQAVAPGTAGAADEAAPAGTLYVPPASPQIEQTWGIRVVGVQVAASRGLVLLRYQVLDESKSQRLHDSDNTGVPELWSEDQDGHVDTVVMGHNHYYGNGLVDGRTFVMIYGNAGGLMDSGEYVTVRMADGLELGHVLVQT
jgi:hypothetical protein